jgi:hypothetical protein
MEGNFEDWIFKGHRGYKSGKISEKYTKLMVLLLRIYLILCKKNFISII